MSEPITFAIAQATAKAGTVELWCRDYGKGRNGRRKFWVINGAWEGSISPDGDVYVVKTRKHMPNCRIVWEGIVPQRVHGGGKSASGRYDFEPDYNEAIAWIEQQIGMKAA